jgi:CheY-like chemotaxis protein
MIKPIALIVEDDQDLATLFRHVLDVAGYQTESILDGKEAMERLEEFPPHLVLLDLQLPGMSGVEILTRMRVHVQLKNIPVIIITAYPLYASSLPVEPDLLLHKPVDINQLSNLVQRLQATQGENQIVHDPVSGLYTFSFFTVRLTFLLERIRQSEFLGFGVLFADVAEASELSRKMYTDDLNYFLRGLAEQFKLALRPTDTMTWSPRDDFFLTLIEEIPNPEAPLGIAGRVRDSMKKFLENTNYGYGLRPNVGVLLCDSEYTDVQQIMKDIDLARTALREGLYTNPSIFNQEMLKKK